MTMRDGAGARPARSISLIPWGKGADVAFIASRRSQVARLQTNSPVSVMFATESLKPSLPNITRLGRLLTPLKNE